MENKNVITYDYRTIKVKREMESMVCDAYENLGWTLTNSSAAEGSIFQINLTFKRDRKVANKIELLKLQERIDFILSNIENLQSKKANAGKIEGISTGVVGTLIFGGGLSMTLVLTGIGYLLGGIALGIAGIGVGLLGWLIYKKISKKKQSKIQPLLESEYDKLSDICEAANKML